MDDTPVATVRIKVGEATTCQVATLVDASKVLIDWPAARRGPFYQMAREKVEAANAGKVTPGEGMAAFVELCRHAGVLVE